MVFVSQFNRPGNAGTGTNPAANLLKVFAGEVFTSFQEENKLLSKTVIKKVGGGAISYTFPAVGTATVSYHTPGANILTDNDGTGRPYLSKILSHQRTVNMDRTLTASVFVDKLDQKLNHWDVMSPYAEELGRALGRTGDVNVSRMIYNIGNTASDTNMTVFGTSPLGPSGGGTFGSTRIATSTAFASLTPAILIKALSNMKVQFDKKNVPKQGRYAMMPPEIMQRLLMDANGVIGGTANGLLQWVNTDFNRGTGNGAFAEGKIPMLFGFELIEHNNLDFPVTTATYGPYDWSAGYGGTGAVADTDTADGKDVNMFTTAGNLPVTHNSLANSNDYTAAYTAGTTEPYIWCWQQQAIGTVKLEDEAVETDYVLECRGNLIVASVTMAHGVRRPECVGLICNT